MKLDSPLKGCVPFAKFKNVTHTSAFILWITPEDLYGRGIHFRPCNSVVEYLFCKQAVAGSNPVRGCSVLF